MTITEEIDMWIAEQTETGEYGVRCSYVPSIYFSVHETDEAAERQADAMNRLEVKQPDIADAYDLGD